MLHIFPSVLPNQDNFLFFEMRRWPTVLYMKALLLLR